MPTLVEPTDNGARRGATFEGGVENASEETEVKFNELLDNTGMQLWLARIEAMEEYVARKHLEWNPVAQRLVYAEAKKSQNVKTTTTLEEVANDTSTHAITYVVGAHFQPIGVDTDKPHNDAAQL